MTGPQANLSAVVSGILFLFWKPMFRMGIRPETTWTRIERSPFAPQAAAAPVLGKPHAAARQRRVEGAQDVRIARATEDGTEVTLELEHVARVLDTREYEAATPLGRRVIPVLSRPRALASAAAICAPVRCPLAVVLVMTMDAIADSRTGKSRARWPKRSPSDTSDTGISTTNHPPPTSTWSGPSTRSTRTCWQTFSTFKWPRPGSTLLCVFLVSHRPST
jgi:hypothetical protein